MNTSLVCATGAVEPLEPRLAPAGTIHLTTSGGVLTVTGDDAANGLSIAHVPSTGLWTISDTLAGTTYVINGVAQAAPFNIPAQSAIRMDLKGGNDDVRIQPSTTPSGLLLPGGLRIAAGAGNDTIELGTSSTRHFVIGGSVQIDLGSGSDLLQMTASGSFGGTFKVLGGADNDEVRLQGVSAEQVYQKGLAIDLGTGSDSLVIEAQRVAVAGALTVKAGGGAGLGSGVAILSSDFAVDGLMSVTAQQGAVALSFGDADSDVFRLAGGLRLAGGPENDSVTVRGTLLAAAGLSLDGKAGNNAVSVLANASVQAESLTLKGLSGTDIFNVGTNSTLVVTDAVSLLLGGGDNTWAAANGASLRLESLRMQGGTGTDIVSFGSSELTVLERLDLILGAGTNTVAFGAGSNVQLGTLSMIGGTGDDTLSGSGSIFTVHGSLTANLGAGSNTVILSSTSQGGVGRHLNFSGLGETDVLVISAPDFSVGGNLQLLLGSGNNTFVANGTALRVGGSLQYTGGLGNDTGVVETDELQVGRTFSFKGGADVSTANVLVLAPANGTLGSVSYQGGRHADTFLLGDSDGVTTVSLSVRGPVSANLGAGPNTAVVTDTVVHSRLNVLSASAGVADALQLRQSTFHAGASLSLGAGNSACSFEDLFVRGPFNLNTGAGDDSVSIEVQGGTAARSQWFGPVKILLGSGNDQLSLGIGPPPDANAGSNFYQDVLADGGSGANTSQSGGNNLLAGSSLTQVNFL